MFISVVFCASDFIAIDMSGRHKVLSYTEKKKKKINVI